jgi:hypothetical protein
MIEVVPGCDPTGHCDGYVGGLSVVDDQKLYFVFTHESTTRLANRVLATFHIVQ